MKWFKRNKANHLILPIIENNFELLDIHTSRRKYYVYILVKKKEIVYVGITSRFWNRIASHKKDKDFDDVYLSKQQYDEYEARDLEATIISVIKPKYNKVQNTIRFARMD